MTASTDRHTDSWNTRIGVILAVTGSAVGLGNFLRFPGLAAKYEGGAFMIPYFCAFLLLGLPLAWAEWATGRYGGVRGFHSGAGVYRTIRPGVTTGGFGVLALLVPVVVYMFYVFIEAWCLGYAWHTLTGGLNMGDDKARYIEFFNDYVGAGGNGSLFSAAGLDTLGLLAFCVAINLWLVYRGLGKGIERCCNIAMPALVVCGLVVLVRVLTLDTPNPDRPDWNLSNGLGFMWNPQTDNVGFLKSLSNPRMWMEAAGQIFFSLGVGFGIIITYSSYLKSDDDVALGGLTACAGNEFCEVALGGLITIPAAFIFLGPGAVAEAAGSSFTLGFKTLPMVFQYMPLGNVVGAIFFFLLFLAALTSSVAMLQPGIALLEEGLGLRRHGAVAVLGAVTVAGTGFVVLCSKDLAALNTLDFWVGTLGIYLLATYQAILFGWVLGIDRGMKELDRGADISIPRLFGFIIKYVSPLYLAIVFGLWVRQQIVAEEDNQFTAIADNPIVLAAVVFIFVTAALFAALVACATRRWRRLERETREAAS